MKGNILDYFMLELPKKKSDSIADSEEKEEKEDKWDENVKKATRTVKRTSIKSRIEDNKMDILIALHACDTATDDAIWCGIQGGAQIICKSSDKIDVVQND